MIESVNDFKGNLVEVDILVKYSQANIRVLDKYKLFNKTAIILLCTYFEVFVEAFISEHVDVMKACFKSDNLPQYMKDNYIDDTFKALKEVAYPSKKQKPLKALFRLHDSIPSDMGLINDLTLDMKYSFGKHGQDDTERLFKKFGFERFVVSPAFQTSFKKINSAICIRNNIIHEGSTPSLTHNDIMTYKNSFLLFANGLEQYVLSNQIALYGKEYYA